jgi:hypothetical protein
MPFLIDWTGAFEVPAGVRAVAEVRLGKLWHILSERTVTGSTSPFRISVDSWTLQYTVDLGSHIIRVEEARAFDAAMDRRRR